MDITGLIGLGVDQETRSLIQSIQTGEITIAAGSASNTATITAVQTRNAVCFFGGWRSADTSLATSEDYCRVSLTNSTTVTAQSSAANAGSTRIVRYTVVEFKPFAIRRIQQGTITISGANATATATITAVNTARAFVVHQGQNHTVNQSDFNYNQGRLDLTNTTTVTATKNATLNPSLVVGYVVVEFNAGIVKSIQQGTANIAGSAATGDAAINAVVDGAALLVNNGWNIGAFAANQGNRMPAIYRTSTTNVRAERGTSGTSVTVQYNFTVVEFEARWVKSRQAARTAIGSGASSANATLSPTIDTGKALLSYLGHFSADTASSVPDTDYPTAKINSTSQATFERGGTPALALTPSWEVFEWL